MENGEDRLIQSLLALPIFEADWVLWLLLALSAISIAAFIALFIADATIAVLDVLAEPDSRRELGGVFRGEYLAHIILSVLIGAMLHAFFSTTFPWIDEPTRAALDPTLMPRPLALILTAMAAGCALVTLFEAAALYEATLPKPRPLHIRTRIRAPLAELWAYTQDHLEHPRWDRRFSRIIMLAPLICTGTTMRYERGFGPLTIRGHGRYKLHRPMRQSTFEFWSDDPRSLIERGAGLWLYTPQPDGTIDFSTAYTYRVRWGAFGRIVDRLIFRPVIKRVTERSFERLRRRFEVTQACSDIPASTTIV